MELKDIYVILISILVIIIIGLVIYNLQLKEKFTSILEKEDLINFSNTKDILKDIEKSKEELKESKKELKEYKEENLNLIWGIKSLFENLSINISSTINNETNKKLINILNDNNNNILSSLGKIIPYIDSYKKERLNKEELLKVIETSGLSNFINDNTKSDEILKFAVSILLTDNIRLSKKQLKDYQELKKSS